MKAIGMYLAFILVGSAVAGTATTRSYESPLVSSCSASDVMALSVETVSASDTAAICEKMNHRIGALPSANSLRELSKAVYTMKYKGGPQNLVDTAYQFMRIAESRGQLSNDAAMINTFGVIYKIYIGMEGRVTPKELNIILSSMGNLPKQMSDDDIYRLAAMHSIQKQDKGN